MSPTTDLSDSPAAAAAQAEQTAVENLLNENSIHEASAMDLDHEQTSISITGATDPAPNPTNFATQAPTAQAPLISTSTPTPTAATTLTPSRIGTPSGIAHPNGTGTSSRAASVQAEMAHTVPTVAREHGAPARQYLNEKVTPHLLEIMKRIGVEQPDNPIRALAEFFDQRATELGQ